MKSVKTVCKLLNLTNDQVKNLINPNRSHRSILNSLGCYMQGKKYLFTDEGVRYIAYQYMSKNEECFKYVYPNKKYVKYVYSNKKYDEKIEHTEITYKTVPTIGKIKAKRKN